MGFDYSTLFRADLPPAAAHWSGFPPFNFIGGHNDPDHTPVAALASGLASVLAREGRTLATYGLESGPQGYRPLRELVAKTLENRTAMACSAEDVLITSGSLQALDLVNAVLLEPGDTVIVEAATYGGTLTRLQRLGVRYLGVPVDAEGIETQRLAALLAELKAKGVRPKYLYTIPTVQNPTGTVMSEARRLELLRLAAEFEIPIFEDDCYADLLFEGTRPPAIRALDRDGRVIYCGSFSKSIAPAIRVGYLVADWPVLSRMLACKSDAGSGALEQMALAEAYSPAAFDAHVADLSQALKTKCETMVQALEEEFGASAEFAMPKGGIFIWVTVPSEVDTSMLAQKALVEGVAINPGAEWTADPATGRRKLRLCFAHASESVIREGIAKLAAICHRETGIPVHSGNVRR
jgi:2-aminoadipate transaminase